RRNRRGDRLVADERTSEVATEDAPDPARVAVVDRPVEVHPLPEELPLLRGRLVAEHALGDVAGEDAREEEHECGDNQERGDRRREALGDESQDHGAGCIAAETRAGAYGPARVWRWFRSFAREVREVELDELDRRRVAGAGRALRGDHSLEHRDDLAALQGEHLLGLLVDLAAGR